MYYHFDAVPGPVRWVGVDKHKQYWLDNDIYWNRGEAFAEKLIPEILEFEFDPIQGTWDHGKHLPNYLKGAKMPLFRDKVVNALIAAGVSNLDFYPTGIKYPESDEICTEYKAVNVVGLVSITQLEVSELEKPLIFRLVEGRNTLVVHEKIRDYFNNHSVKNISFNDLSSVAIF